MCKTIFRARHIALKYMRHEKGNISLRIHYMRMEVIELNGTSNSSLVGEPIQRSQTVSKRGNGSFLQSIQLRLMES